MSRELRVREMNVGVRELGLLQVLVSVNRAS